MSGRVCFLMHMSRDRIQELVYGFGASVAWTHECGVACSYEKMTAKTGVKQLESYRVLSVTVLWQGGKKYRCGIQIEKK